jgi:hypothetical protein
MPMHKVHRRGRADQARAGRPQDRSRGAAPLAQDAAAALRPGPERHPTNREAGPTGAHHKLLGHRRPHGQALAGRGHGAHDQAERRPLRARQHALRALRHLHVPAGRGAGFPSASPRDARPGSVRVRALTQSLPAPAGAPAARGQRRKRAHAGAPTDAAAPRRGGVPLMTGPRNQA